MNVADYVIFNSHVFRSKREQTVTVSPRYPGPFFPNRQPSLFIDGAVFQITIRGSFTYGDPYYHPFEASVRDGQLTFPYTFEAEQEYRVIIRSLSGPYEIITSFYALDDDLFGLFALKGDLHMHTTYSDGYETPEYRAATARMHGFDFIAITDHNNYGGSVHLIDAMKEIPHNMVFLHGEEVHATDCRVHILSLGAREAIGPKVIVPEIVKEIQAYWTEHHKTGTPTAQEMWDYMLAHHPDRMEAMFTDGREKELRQMASYHSAQLAKIDRLRTHYKDIVPADVDLTAFIAAMDVFDKIREAGGLSVLCHIYRDSLDYRQHKRSGIPDQLARALAIHRNFDAFEIVSSCRERDTLSNDLQGAFYEKYLEKDAVPVLSVTDTHVTIQSDNYGAPIFGKHYVIVFAKSFDEAGIIDAIKERRSVAVDEVSGKAVCRGALRYVKFARFLLSRYFPAHDMKVGIEGFLMERCLQKEAKPFDRKDEDLLASFCADNAADLCREWAPVAVPFVFDSAGNIIIPHQSESLPLAIQ